MWGIGERMEDQGFSEMGGSEDVWIVSMVNNQGEKSERLTWRERW